MPEKRVNDERDTGTSRRIDPLPGPLLLSLMLPDFAVFDDTKVDDKSCNDTQNKHMHLIYRPSHSHSSTSPSLPLISTLLLILLRHANEQTPGRHINVTTSLEVLTDRRRRRSGRKSQAQSM